jgi:hypothetical protein
LIPTAAIGGFCFKLRQAIATYVPSSGILPSMLYDFCISRISSPLSLICDLISWGTILNLYMLCCRILIPLLLPSPFRFSSVILLICRSHYTSFQYFFVHRVGHVGGCVVAIFSCFLAIHAAGVIVLIWALSGVVPTFCAVRANFIINTAIFCHMLVALAFVASTYHYKIPHFASVPTYVDFTLQKFFSYLGGGGTSITQFVSSWSLRPVLKQNLMAAMSLSVSLS